MTPVYEAIAIEPFAGAASFTCADIKTFVEEKHGVTVTDEDVTAAIADVNATYIDKVIFSTAAAGAGPAGLLNGIAALNPNNGTDKGQNLIDDMQQLATSVAPVAGNGDIVLVASPDAAVALRLRTYGTILWPVLTSGSLAAKIVIAAAANSIVSAVEGAPVIEASQDTEWVPDTVPQEIVTAAGTVATSIGSSFQKDAIVLRLRWLISWGLRTPTGIAWLQNVNW
jgi:hypothetical protein